MTSPSTIADVLDGLDQTLTGVIGDLSFYRLLAGPVATPAVVAADIDVTPNEDMGGACTFDVELTVVTETRGDWDVSDLVEMLEPANSLSVPSVLEADPTLGGKVDTLEITKIGSMREITAGGSTYWGGTVSVSIDGHGGDD